MLSVYPGVWKRANETGHSGDGVLDVPVSSEKQHSKAEVH